MAEPAISAGDCVWICAFCEGLLCWPNFKRETTVNHLHKMLAKSADEQSGQRTDEELDLPTRIRKKPNKPSEMMTNPDLFKILIDVYMAADDFEFEIDPEKLTFLKNFVFLPYGKSDKQETKRLKAQAREKLRKISLYETADIFLQAVIYSGLQPLAERQRN
jgi:hypothetical protein